MPDEVVSFKSIRWNIPEYSYYERSKRWYLAAGLLAFLLVAYAVVTSNLLFALIVIILALMSFTTSIRKPRQVQFEIRREGLFVGDRFLQWKMMDSFWIVYDPPDVKNIYFDMKGLRPTLTVPLENQDPTRIRKILRQFLIEHEDKDDEPFSEFMGRILKI